MKKKVLIIEDEENLIELLRVNLSAGGFDVLVANDGEDGLLKSFSETPNAIILDVRLPQIDGWKVCRELKGNAGTKNIPVIILTAASQKSDFEEAKNAGCDLFLTKPFDPLRLVKIVDEITSIK